MNYTKNMKFGRKAERGYIALLATVITGFILLGLAVDGSLAGWHARFNVLTSQNKEQANALAEGCADQALAQVISDPGYQKTIDTSTAQGNCHVTIDTTTQLGVATIKSQGDVQGSFSNLQMSVILNKVHIGEPGAVPYGLLLVSVAVRNDSGGTNQASDFTISVPAGSVPSFTGPSAGTSVAEQITGNYQVSEAGPTGYSVSFAGDCNTSGAGSVAAGEVKSCSVTLDDIPTTLTLIANVTNNASPPGTKQASDFQLKIDGNNVTQNTPISVTPGTHTASGPGADSSYNVSSWGYNCNPSGTITLAQGEQRTCIINYDDVTPPGPECAETVMMLDRTITVFSSNVQGAEQAAADALLDLYAALSNPPKVGVGSFGGLDGSHASVPVAGYMTNSYGSKGGPGSFTPAKNPGSVASGNWSTTPDLGRLNDGGYAKDSTPGHNQGYTAFGITLPAGAVIDGIEVTANGKATGNMPAQNSGNILATAIGNYPSGWTTNGANNRITDVQVNDQTDYINTSTNNAVQTFALANANIQAGSTINSVSFYAVARGTSNGASIKMRLENSTAGGHQWDDGNHNLTTSYVAYQYNGAPVVNNPATGVKWTLNDVNTWAANGGMRFGVVRTNSSNISPRVTQVYAVVNYTPPPSGDLAVQLWSASTASWTAVTPAQVITFTNADAASPYVLGGPSDKWGKPSWTIPDVGNTFQVSVTNNAPAGITMNLNYVTAKVYYSIPMTGLYDVIRSIFVSQYAGTYEDAAINVGAQELNGSRHVAGKQKVLVIASDGDTSHGATHSSITTAANNAKNSGIQIFAMHFGDPTGTSEMQSWVSPSTLPNIPYAITASGAKRVGSTVTITTSAAHQIAVNQRVTVSGVTGSGSCAVANAINGTFPVTAVTPTTFTYTSTNGSTNLNCGGGTVMPTNLFEAPSSVQMPGVFTAIGTQACPALALQSTPPPTTGTLTVVTNVINDSGNGNKTANQFNLRVATTTSQTNSGNVSGLSLPIVPGSYNVTDVTNDPNYTVSYGINCSAPIVGAVANIAAGETRTCTVTYDDIPSPIAPPNLDINLGSWQEKPK